MDSSSSQNHTMEVDAQGFDSLQVHMWIYKCVGSRSKNPNRIYQTYEPDQIPICHCHNKEMVLDKDAPQPVWFTLWLFDQRATTEVI